MFFILCQKLFSFSRYLYFCHNFSVMEKNGLNKKAKVDLKIYEVTDITILPNKGNQEMKFGQLSVVPT